MKRRELALERLHRNGLVKPFDSIDACVYGLAGIQSQVQQFAELAIWNRCTGSPTTKALGREYDSYRLINVWGQRNTLHTYVPADWDTICDLYHNRTHIRSRIPRESQIIQKGVARICSQQNEGHLLSREKIHQLVNEEPLSDTNPALTTYLYLNYLSTNGVLFGVPAKPSIGKFAFGSVLDRQAWHSDPARVSASLDTIMLRYFTHYGPATVQDFAIGQDSPWGLPKPRWSGLNRS